MTFEVVTIDMFVTFCPLDNASTVDPDFSALELATDLETVVMGTHPSRFQGLSQLAQGRSLLNPRTKYSRIQARRTL